MFVLALDTTTRGGSCAVVRDGTVLREHATDPARSHDAQLPSALMAVLEDARVALSQIDVYAVATGPGSFTGLRVGIAAMQGVAFAAGRPLIGISAFDALVAEVRVRDPSAHEAFVATWVDAWRGEVYASLFHRDRVVEPPTVERPASLLSRYGGREGRYLFIGEAAGMYHTAIADAMGDRARVAHPVAPPLAGRLALMGADAARAGHRPPPHAIRPLYVRRPDAELARNARPVQ
jgi:tRNA threonylcarbamoyladenosine biosynthesis protein TsaB